MCNNIETVTNTGTIPEEVRAQHKGFSIWDDNYISKRDHDTILQVNFLHKTKTLNPLCKHNANS